MQCTEELGYGCPTACPVGPKAHRNKPAEPHANRALEPSAAARAPPSPFTRDRSAWLSGCAPGGAEEVFVSRAEGVRPWVFVSGCSFLVVRLRRRTGRRPASGPDLACRLGFRGRGSTASRWTPLPRPAG